MGPQKADPLGQQRPFRLLNHRGLDATHVNHQTAGGELPGPPGDIINGHAGMKADNVHIRCREPFLQGKAPVNGPVF